jgi:hypothetical protein
VINLCNLLQYIPHNSQLGMELLSVLDHFVAKNLHSSSFIKNKRIDREVYMKICKSKPVLTNEIRACFLGITERKIEEQKDQRYALPADEDDIPDEDELLRMRLRKQKPKPPKLPYHSVVAPIQTTDGKEPVSKDFLFHNVEGFVFDDISSGQRGFERNIDRLCNRLIQYFSEEYPKQRD